MITARNQRNRWVVPKGNVEPGETPRQSALREAAEEAGLLGKLRRRPLGSYEYLKGGRPRSVVVFLLLVTRQRQRWSEDDLREREWIRVDRAIKRARQSGLRQILRDLAERL